MYSIVFKLTRLAPPSLAVLHDVLHFVYSDVQAFTNTGASSNTYFFGSGGGLDTISFTQQGHEVKNSAGYGLTIAVDDSYGTVPSNPTPSSADSIIAIGTGAFIFVGSYTGGANSNTVSTRFGFTITTVSSSVITDLDIILN